MSHSDNDSDNDNDEDEDEDEDEDNHELLKCAISLRFNGARLKLSTKKRYETKKV